MPWPRLYAIVDVDACARHQRLPIEVVDAYLTAGVRLLQIRAKTLPGGAFLDLVDAAARRTAAAGATLIVNDRVDLAAAAGTGVHVGQDDVPPGVARRLLGPSAIVGVSTHDPEQLRVALDAAPSYVAYGPVFDTMSKAHPDPVVGLDGVAAAARTAAAAGVPLVAIGGITLTSAPAVLAAGAAAVAVIGDLLAGTDGPEARARRFLMALDEAPV